MKDNRDLNKSALNSIKNIWSENTDMPEKAEFKDSRFVKLINILTSTSIGKHFVYVLNPFKGQFEYVSKDITKVLGYQPENFNLAFYISLIHPDDLPFILEIQEKVAEFCNTNIPEERMEYKYCYDFRLRTNDGNYIQAYLQYFYLEMNKNFQAMRVMTILSDISHIKVGGTPHLSVFKMADGLVKIVNEKRVNRITLTAKENEIFEFLIKGFTSQDIGEALGISKHTVDTHRRNILKRNHCSNTSELLNLYFGED